MGNWKIKSLLAGNGATTRKATSELDIKIKAAALILERLETFPPSAEGKRALVEECRQWLAEAQPRTGIKKFWKQFSSLDASYQCLHSIRHHLCKVLPEEELISLIREIEFDLSYIRDEKQYEECKKDLATISEYLNPLKQKPQAVSKITSNQDLRKSLVHLSEIVARHRERVWHKVNLMRTRLMTTLGALVAFLIISILFAPEVLQIKVGKPGTAILWQHIFLLQIFGAMGGALSALRVRESQQLQIAEFYSEQAMLYLRPAVGATAGLMLGLLQLTGIVAILGKTSQENEWAILLVVAFLGGFSERFFIRRLESLVGKEGGKGPSKSPSEKKQKS